MKAGLPVEGTAVASQSEENRPAEGGQPGPQRGGRVRAPEGLKCGLDDLTLYDGEIIAYERKVGSTRVRVKTNFDTTEEVTLDHPGTDDPAKLFLINGGPFKSSDWRKIERRKYSLRPGMRANIWVCVGNTTIQPVIDWQPDDTGAYPRSR